MEALEILKKLVSFNTIQDKENEQIMDYIKTYVENLGFQTKRIEKCLVATIGTNPTLGFIGHTDTVDAVAWDTNPFTLQIEGNKLIGLGVCDMKGGIAAFLSALSKVDLTNKNLSLYFTYDEETSFSGIKALQKEIFPNTVLIGEPTDNHLVYGTKGLMEMEITFYGKSCHSSTPEKGINAIYACLDFINKIKNFYENTLKKETIKEFEIPYTTMNIGTIKGGESINSVPSTCTITLDFRIVSNSHIEWIKKEVNNLLKPYHFELKIQNVIKPKLNLEDLSSIEAISTKKETVNYITEASFIESNTIILGVGPITAHEKNEFITLESLNLCTDIYQKIIEQKGNLYQNNKI